jgi:exodeoxyribonuclease VII small subunit
MTEKKENNSDISPVRDQASNGISKLTFEQAIKKLTDIVSKIEDGQISLEQSLTQYEQGMELIKHCRVILQKAEKKIEEISQEKEK